MSNEIVENLLEQIKGLAVSERNKFSSYKTRNLRQELSEAEAVINAAARIGVYPTIQQPNPTVLEAVGNVLDQGGKVLNFPHTPTAQVTGIFESNTDPTASNTHPTPSEIKQNNGAAEGEKFDSAQAESNTDPTVVGSLPTGRDWIQIAKRVGYGLVFLICTSALIHLSAEAAGGGTWAYFWAVLTEGGGVACIIHPARGWNKTGLVALGILCIALGYSTMLTGVFKKSSSDLTQTVATNQSVKDLDDQVAQAKKGVMDAEKLRDDLPPTWVSKKREAQKEVDKKSEELKTLYASIKAEREKAATTTDASIIGLWTGVEGARRFILMIFSIVVGHAFFRSCIPNKPKRLNA